MERFLQILVSYPVVPLTSLMGVVLVYWLFVIFGALGVDALDGDSHGVADAHDGSGIADGLGDGHAIEGVGKGAAHDGGFLEALGLGGIPLTVAVSFLVFFAFAISLVATQFLEPLFSSGLVRFALGSGILLAALVASAFLSRVAIAPFRKVFVANEAPSRRSAILGKVCVITSTQVDGRFGQATIEDGGAGLLLNVFCKKPNGLKKGDRALVLDHDPRKDTFEIEPVEWLLPEEVQGLEDPSRAKAIAAAHRTR